MRKIFLFLLFTKSGIASEHVVCRPVHKATQEYVEHLARCMGIKRTIGVLMSADGQWAAAPKEGYVLIPAQADTVFSDRRARLKRSAALQRGLLMHELGHLRQESEEQKGAMQRLYLWWNSAEQLRLSRKDEQAADAAVLNDRDVLGALRDFFVKRSGVASVEALEKVSDAELFSQAWAKSTHPSDAARALYFNRRLQALEQKEQEDVEETLRVLFMSECC